MGENAEDTLASTDITNDDRKKYTQVIAKFDAFFQVRKNVIFERARFNRRNQEGGESAEQFITSLYSLAENCNYGDLKDDLIRDRIVVGIRDKALSERLQLDPELTLEKAKKVVRQREAVQEQQQILKSGPKEEKFVDFLKQRNPHKGKCAPQRQPKGGKPQKPAAANPPGTNRRCSRCGKSSHARDLCPAKDAECYTCKRKGHFSSQCFSKSVAEVSSAAEPTDEYYDTAFLNTIGAGHTTAWNSTIAVNGQEAVFKLDTGAEVSVISEDVLASLSLPKPHKTTKRLYGPDRQPLNVLGELPVTLSYKGRSCAQPVYIVKELQHNLLGLPAIQALNLLTQVDTLVEAPVPQQFPALFTGLGTIQDSFTIKLKPDAQPFALFTPRNVAIPLRKKVREELTRMESLGVISPVEEPTPWCAGMVVVPKKSGSVRICVDFRPLNEHVLREVHPMPKVDETLAQLTGAKVFSKLDANCGFWQIPLAESSRHLTTFLTPYGRFCFNKLPFGISSAPEHFQRMMSTILVGLKGVLCHVDDVMVFAPNQEEHDIRLQSALAKIQAAGLTLNKAKCEFSKERLTFLGHVVDKNGISADPQKTSAILEMEKPKSLPELRRFMGMVNQLSKFSPNIAELSKPLRELLSTRKAWVWGPSQDEAFANVKLELTRPTVLALYDPEATTKICADASAYGLGAVLLQQHADTHWKPVAYASRSMSDTERRYSQIEKEALALAWACEKFSNYILGKTVHLETDHKPLVPLLSRTNLDSLPARVLRFRLRLTRFAYTISHVPGKFLYTADTLSRAPVASTDDTQLQEETQTEFFASALISTLPASQDRLDEYRTAQQEDSTCRQLISFCKQGWPDRPQLQGHLSPYWQVRGELTLHEDLLLYGNRIVVPKSLQAMTLQKIHNGHQGIQRCRLHTSSAVWWPGVSKDIERVVTSCPICAKASTPHKEPLMYSPLPNHPWEKVGSDLFELNGATYLLVVDYFSRYIEVQKLSSTNSKSVILALKAIFSRHGVPVTFVSDNGPQYTSREMQEFAESYGFKQVTSSPHFPQSNGMAERSVKTVKSLLDKSNDPYMAILSYRTTPLPWCNLSLAELLMGRRLKTDIPQPKKAFVPEWPHLTGFREKDKEWKDKQKSDYDKRHRVKTLPPLPDDQSVWIHTQDRQCAGRVLHPAAAPRSYIVETPTGRLRRNRSHLVPIPEGTQMDTPESDPPPTRSIATRSSTGTYVGPPSRLTYWRKGDVA